MMKKEDVLHIAHLAHIDLQPDEVTRFQKNLSDLFDSLSVLQTVNIKSVLSTDHIPTNASHLRPDSIHPYTQTSDLLTCSPNITVHNQIQIPPVL